VQEWNIARARDAYCIAHWGGNYFDVDAHGHVLVAPGANPAGARIDLHELAEQIEASGLSMPVLVRFPDILRDRVERLCKAFETAMRDYAFTGGYQPAYPIKVNQQRTVVESILSTGMVGLEAGSKPELMAVLGILEAEDGLVICNGYKDREYIRLALIGQQLGSQVYIVLEKRSELELVIDEARSLGVRPRLGVRMRLASIGRGKWQDTGGDRSKFGLTAAGLLEVVERLAAEGMTDTLQLLHVHLGSQIANIRDIHTGLHETARRSATST
jgi:arginine decarboxylase